MHRFVPLLLGLGLLLAGPAAAQTTYEVAVNASSFNPANLTIEAGDTVRWTNNSGIHSVNGTLASYPSNPEGFGNTVASAPWTYEFTFTIPGTYDYHCDVHGAPGVGMRGTITVEAGTSPLIISEYVEGSSNNKAIELYNPSGSPVDLDAGDYTLKYFFNGSDTAGFTADLTGSVPAGDVFVLAHSSAVQAILDVADQTLGGSWYNGDDAVVLFLGASVVDAIGQVGFDPGSEWGTDSTSTADNTLRREDDACTADTDTTDAFDPAVNYTGYPQDTYDGLGSPGNLDCGGGGCSLSFVGDVTATVNGAGTSVSFAGRVANAGPGTKSVRLRVSYNRNGGPPTGTLTYGPVNLAQTGGNGVPFKVNQPIPGAAPPGTYNLTFELIDAASGTVCATDNATIVLSAPATGGGTEWIAAPLTFEASAGASASGAGVTAYPNPTAGTAVLRYTLAEGSDVRLVVYDALGREVAVLVDGRVEAGVHEAVLDARALPAGVYVYRLTAGAQVQAGRLTLVR